MWPKRLVRKIYNHLLIFYHAGGLFHYEQGLSIRSVFHLKILQLPLRIKLGNVARYFGHISFTHGRDVLPACSKTMQFVLKTNYFYFDLRRAFVYLLKVADNLICQISVL